MTGMFQDHWRSSMTLTQYRILEYQDSDSIMFQIPNALLLLLLMLLLRKGLTKYHLLAQNVFCRPSWS